MIHVVFGVDGYISQLAVSMVSMFESNKQNLIQTHIVCINLNANDKDKLYQIALKYNREIKFRNNIRSR